MKFEIIRTEETVALMLLPQDGVDDMVVKEIAGSGSIEKRLCTVYENSPIRGFHAKCDGKALMLICELSVDADNELEEDHSEPETTQPLTEATSSPN